MASMVNSRGCINRFFLATNGNLDNTIKRLKATAKWRKDHDVDSLDCQYCLLDHTTHYLHLIGHTAEGHPILYSNFKLPNFPRTEAGKKGVLDHMILTFEGAIRSSPNPSAQFVWLNDFYGFGLVDAANVSLPMTFISMMASHYPERLKHLLILDAPSIISPLWNLCRPIIDPKTHQKIKFLPYDLDLDDSSKLDEEAISWLDEEMKAVRLFGTKKGPRPIYNLSLIRKCAKDKNLPPLPSTSSDLAKDKGEQEGQAVAAAAAAVSHSHYGTRSLMKMLMRDVSCLHPLKLET